MRKLFQKEEKIQSLTQNDEVDNLKDEKKEKKNEKENERGDACQEKTFASTAPLNLIFRLW